jgi:hypothetical protein
LADHGSSDTHAFFFRDRPRRRKPPDARAPRALLIVSGVAADLDLLSYFGGPNAFYRLHGTLLHSVAGSAALALAIAGLALFLDRRLAATNRPSGYAPLRFSGVLAVCAIGCAGHLLLDFFSDNPIRLWWPF